MPSLAKRVQQLEHQLLLARTAIPACTSQDGSQLVGECTSGRSEHEPTTAACSQSWTIQRGSKCGIDEFHAVTNYPLDLDSTLNGIRADLGASKHVDHNGQQTEPPESSTSFGSTIQEEDGWTSGRDESTQDDGRLGKRRRLDGIGMEMGFESGQIRNPDHREPDRGARANAAFGMVPRSSTTQDVIACILNEVEIEQLYQQ